MRPPSPEIARLSLDSVPLLSAIFRIKRVEFATRVSLSARLRLRSGKYLLPERDFLLDAIAQLLPLRDVSLASAVERST